MNTDSTATKPLPVLDFIRANPGCTYLTPGAKFNAGRLAALHRAIDAGKVRYESVTTPAGNQTWAYWVVDNA